MVLTVITVISMVITIVIIMVLLLLTICGAKLGALACKVIGYLKSKGFPEVPWVMK